MNNFKQKIIILTANIFFVFHCLLGIFILIGWLFPQIKIIYLAVMLVWLACWILLGYCPITKWEFTLRRRYDKSINPSAEAIQYYLYKFFNKNVSSKAIFTGGLIVFIILIVLSIINQ